MSTVFANGDYGFVGWQGQSVRVSAGDEWPLDDPFVQAHPEMFTGAAPAEAEKPAPKKRGGRRG